MGEERRNILYGRAGSAVPFHIYYGPVLLHNCQPVLCVVRNCDIGAYVIIIHLPPLVELVQVHI